MLHAVVHGGIRENHGIRSACAPPHETPWAQHHERQGEQKNRERRERNSTLSPQWLLDGRLERLFDLSPRWDLHRMWDAREQHCIGRGLQR